MTIVGASNFLRSTIGALVLDVLTLAPNPSVADDEEWLHYGGNQWNERHAQLKRINYRLKRERTSIRSGLASGQFGTLDWS